jgi:exodeoxyribonuclease V alpha subunit
MKPNDDFLSPVVWGAVNLVIVDEASMLTLEMLAGILCKVNPACRVMLLGDLDQLLSVGSGNILPDLLALDVPHIQLEINHRQDTGAQALLHNVTDFAKIHGVSELHFDSSFVFRGIPERTLQDALVSEAAQRYRNGEDIQVLSPFNRVGMCSVHSLNLAIQERVNPAAAGKKELSAEKSVFRDGDRVMICQNDRERDCSNGDVGILHIIKNDTHAPEYFVALADGRRPRWNDASGLRQLSLAYALTVHKSQGSEHDTILMAIAGSFAGMLYRNLFYTAISRAKKRVILFGEQNALGVALQRPARKRCSMLVSKTRMRMMEVSA